MTDSKIFGGIVEPQALNPQIVEIALHWNGSLEAFVTAYKNFEDALYPDKPEPLPEKYEKPKESDRIPEDYGVDEALADRFKAEYRNGHNPILGEGACGVWDAFNEMGRICDDAQFIRTLDEYDALIQRWRTVSKKVAFLEKKNVERVIGGLERVVEYQTSGPEKRYIAAGLAMLKRLA